MSQKQELNSLAKKSFNSSNNTIELLDSYVDYAELCSDPDEVFKYMEDKRICVALSRYWTEKAQLYCRMGNFRKAIEELQGVMEKPQDYCLDKQENAKFKSDIEQGLRKIEEELAIVLIAKPAHKRSLQEYEAIHGQKQSPKNIRDLPIVTCETKDVPRIRKLLDVYEKECGDDQLQREKEFKSSCTNKPRCSLKNDLQSNEPKLRRTHSILHKPTINLSNIKQNDAKSCHSPKSGVKFERNQTMDSIEILKKKKTILRPSHEHDLQEIPIETRMYRTTSFLEKKRVHFGISDAKIKNTAGPKIEKFRSADLDRIEEHKIESFNLRDQLSKEINKAIESESASEFSEDTHLQQKKKSE